MSETAGEWLERQEWEEAPKVGVPTRQETWMSNSYEITVKIVTPAGEEIEATEPLSKRVVDGSPRGAKKAIDEVVVLVATDVVAEVVAKLGPAAPGAE